MAHAILVSTNIAFPGKIICFFHLGTIPKGNLHISVVRQFSMCFAFVHILQAEYMLPFVQYYLLKDVYRAKNLGRWRLCLSLEQRVYLLTSL